MKKIHLEHLAGIKDDEIYYKGDLSLLAKPRVSVVGSRKMSVYTKNLLSHLVSKLSSIGVCVVSGGAIGVDIWAAEHSYPNTIAVFANSLDTIYPKQNQVLIQNIYQNALAFSEHKDNKNPKKWDFLERNRIVVGLGEFLIIAQADLKSGSLNSANHAIKQGKQIFVLPQRAGESDGTNELLWQNKAKLIYDIDVFLEYVANYFGLNQSQKDENDEILSFLKTPKTIDEMVGLFKDRVYEYELMGLVRIDGVMVYRN